MKNSLIIASIIFSAFMLVNGQAQRQCGTTISASQIQAAEAHFEANKVEEAEGRVADPVSITIPVHFHVVTAGNSLEEGNIPDSQVQASMDVLNQDFASTGLRFLLVNTTRTEEPSWFHTARADFSDPVQTEMKAALRVGGASVLNIWSVGFTSTRGLLGYASYPWAYTETEPHDGVVILYSTVPGGSRTPFDLGRTLTHEVGHWVGLYHTFDGGCDEPGDYVFDTPQEASPASGCQIGRDSCPDHPGLDPIHNYMDYSVDACMNEFTQGQGVRLRAQIATYRGISIRRRG